MVQVKIGPGDYYVTAAANEFLVTILGSCVAVCMRDPVLGVGGMNHFLLAESASGEWGGMSAATRYGNHAMETLINDIIALGGVRSRFEVKVFGGGQVIDSSMPIGQNNVEFAERYLSNEACRSPPSMSAASVRVVSTISRNGQSADAPAPSRHRRSGLRRKWN